MVDPPKQAKSIYPIKWDLPYKTKLISTVHFDDRFFKVGNNQYEILGTEVINDPLNHNDGDCLHIVRNTVNKVVREIYGSQIRQWL